ncbi:MAG: uroporphyrinogen decarboxylase/cobalamine-independent methonine synthase family protein [Candidatus Aquicultorales bacterium]
MSFKGELLPTAIGSVPWAGVDHALREVFVNFDRIPFWPQLPKRSFRENMYVQFIESLPGAVRDEVNERIFFDTGDDLSTKLASLYEAYLQEDLDFFALNEGSAEGFFAFLNVLETGSADDLEVAKGHITGPISLGLAVTDQNKKPVLYNDVIRDAIIKSLSMNIKWQERRIREVRPEAETLIFIDEPYLASYGSAYISLAMEDAVGFLNELATAAEGLVGVHCCGNTDWNIIIESQADVLSLDAYDYAQSLALYADQVGGFLARGGIIAWGIVPSGLPSPDQITRENVESLVGRLENAMVLLEEKGVPKETIVRQAIVTPNCGTAAMLPEHAELTFKLTREVSDVMRERYL